MKTKHIILSALIVTTLTPNKVSAKTEIEQSKEISVPKSVLFSENGKPRALDVYWYNMAQCETGGDWKNSGRWAGGLGIYIDTWNGYGGKEFASKPNLATPQQQIIVANRISTQGYQTKNEYLTLDDKLNKRPFFREPVGFGGWGCKKHVGNPVLFKKFPYKTLFHKYHLGERSAYVYNLQKILGVRYIDGWYGEHTDRVYNKFFMRYRQIIIAEYNKYKSA